MILALNTGGGGLAAPNPHLPMRDQKRYGSYYLLGEGGNQFLVVRREDRTGAVRYGDTVTSLV